MVKEPTLLNPRAMNDNAFDFALDRFHQGYLECAAWLAADFDGSDSEHDDIEFAADDFSHDASQQALVECTEFLKAVWAHSEPFAKRMAQAGHDFWLTRNGHGAGFWDDPQDYGGKETADWLSAIAKSYGTVYTECMGGSLEFVNG